MRKLLRYLKPYRWLAALAVLMTLMQSLSDLWLPTLMREIVDKGIPSGDIAYILTTGVLMLGVATLGALCAVLGGYVGAKGAMGFGTALRSAVFHKVEGMSEGEISRIGTPSLITRTTNDITQVQSAVEISLRFMVMAPLMAVGGVVMALRLSPQLSRILLFVIPVLGAVVALVGARAMPLFKAMQGKVDRLNLVLREGLTGVRVVRAFGREGHESQRFAGANRDLMQTALKVNRMMALMFPLLMLGLNLVNVVVMWLGANSIQAGQMEVGALMAFTQYIMLILGAVMMGSMMFIMLPRAAASAQRINEVLDTPESIQDPAAPAKLPQHAHLAFENVGFAYPHAEEPVLTGISFEAYAGQTVAVIGSTGSGKSTLIALIPRLFDVSEGRVLLGGVDVRDLTQEDLRARIGYVPQKAVLFSGTVAENIRYGKSDATLEQVREAAKIAQADDFIMALEDGYDAEVSQGGTNFSGGQRQRLSIARALVRKPQIYIFDDSFSALDYQTDARLRASLAESTRDAVVLIVAQRVSTILHADRILVLDEGRLCGSGTHEELLDTCEVYREIVTSQLTLEEIA